MQETKQMPKKLELNDMQVDLHIPFFLQGAFPATIEESEDNRIKDAYRIQAVAIIPKDKLQQLLSRTDNKLFMAMILDK